MTTALPRLNLRSLLVLTGVTLLAGSGDDRLPTPVAQRPTGAAPSSPAPPVAPAAPVWPLTVVDGLNRRVTIPRAPQRIASLAPSNTELVFAVGGGDRLVGRTTVCDYPPEATRIPATGGMTPRTANLEALVALRPDLILATGGVQEPLMAPLERLGLPVVALDADDFAGVARNVRLVGTLLDRPTEGERLATAFLGRVAAVEAQVKARRTRAPRVLYLVGDDPLMTVGPHTFIGRMIATAGGVNLFADATTRYPRPSEEVILSRDPEVIVLPTGAMTARQGTDAERQGRLAARPGWSSLTAVRTHRLRTVPEDAMSRPTPRLADGLEALAKALEPLGSPPK